MMTQQVHANSKEAYHNGAIRLNSRAKAIMQFLRHAPEPMTDRQIQKAMRFETRADVQPRISDLIRFGLVREVDKTKCGITGKTVRRVEAVTIESQGELF
jgi:hypothetical protein